MYNVFTEFIGKKSENIFYFKFNIYKYKKCYQSEKNDEKLLI